MAHRVQRLISALLIATLGLQSVSCSTVPASQRPAGSEVAADIAPGDDGWTRLHAIPTWSNGQATKETLAFRADKPDRYLLFAYENGHGLVPVSYEKAPTPSASSSGSKSFSWCCGGPDPVGAGVLILAGLLVLGVAALIKSATATSRPSPDCCFVWIEDAETGETLAGGPPWGLPHVQSAMR